MGLILKARSGVALDINPFMAREPQHRTVQREVREVAGDPESVH